MSIYDLAETPISDEEREEQSTNGFDIRQIVTHNLQKNETIDRKGRISPSSGCSLCPRQAFLTGIDSRDVSFDAAFTFHVEIGKKIEDIVADGMGKLLIKQGIRLWENEELRLGAELDLLIKDYDDKLIIAEVKSCGELPSKSRIYQLWQLQLYMAYYRCDGIMIYASRHVEDNKRRLKIRQFEVPFNLYEARLAIVNSFISRKSIDLGKLPPKGSLIKTDSDCGFCDFTFACWKTNSFNYEEMTDEEYIEILEQADKYADNFLSNSEVRKRRLDMYSKIETSLDEESFMKMFRFLC